MMIVSTACVRCTVAMPLLRLPGVLAFDDLPTSTATCTSPALFVLPTTTLHAPVLARNRVLVDKSTYAADRLTPSKTFLLNGCISRHMRSNENMAALMALWTSPTALIWCISSLCMLRLRKFPPRAVLLAEMTAANKCLIGPVLSTCVKPK